MSRRSIIVAAALLVVAALSALAARQVLDARSLAQHAADRLIELERDVGPEDLIVGDVADDLIAAAHDFDRASAKLSSAALTPFRAMPILGRQIRAFDHQVAALRDGANITASGIVAIGDRFDGDLSTPESRIDALAFLADQARQIRTRLSEVDPGAGNALIGPLHESHEKLTGQLRRLDRDLLVLADDAETLAELLTGPRSMLLIAANNAEMRAGSGMFLQAGVLRIAGGRAELVNMRPTAELLVPPAVAPTLSDDHAALWGWANPNQEWRNLAMSPRFPEAARLAASMWVALGNEPVDGVVVVDPVALEALLKGTGTLVVGDEAVSADDVVDELTRRQYEDFDDDDQPERREGLARFAETAFERLSSAEVDVGVLAKAGRSAARGRHVLAWSNDDALQAAFRDLGVDGELEADSLLVGLLNAGGSKLDRHVDVSAGLQVATGPEGSAVRLDILVSNDAKPSLPEFVFGPYERLGISRGTYLANLAVSLPAAAFDVSASERFDAGPDGPSRVVIVPVSVPLGESTEVTITFSLPQAGGGEILVEPSARIPAVEWAASDAAWRDFRPRRLLWGDTGRALLTD